MPDRRQQITATLNNFYQKPVARVSLELFLSVAAVIFFAVFAIRPTLVTMSDLVKEIEDKRALDQQMTQKIAALSSAQVSYLDIQDRLFLLDQALPTSPDVIGTMKLIEKIASDRNILIDTLSVSQIPREVEADVPFSELSRLTFPVSLSVTGDYNQIRSFVEGLIENRRSFIVDTVIFSTSEERGQSKLRAAVTISVPYFGEEIIE